MAGEPKWRSPGLPRCCTGRHSVTAAGLGSVAPVSLKSITTLTDTDLRTFESPGATLRHTWRMDHGRSPTGTTPVHHLDGFLPCGGRVAQSCRGPIVPHLARLRSLRLLDVGCRHGLPPSLSDRSGGSSRHRALPVGGSFDITFTGEVRDTNPAPTKSYEWASNSSASPKTSFTSSISWSSAP